MLLNFVCKTISSTEAVCNYYNGWKLIDVKSGKIHLKRLYWSSNFKRFVLFAEWAGTQMGENRETEAMLETEWNA